MPDGPDNECSGGSTGKQEIRHIGEQENFQDSQCQEKDSFLKVRYREVEVPSDEGKRRVESAFAILFEAVAESMKANRSINMDN
jgi:hypothetical protein